MSLVPKLDLPISSFTEAILSVTFRFHQPTFPLNLAVENIVFYEGYSPPHHKERLLPDGGIDLVIDLTQVPNNLYDNEDFGQFASFKKSWISGFRREFITIDAGQNSSMMVVRFRAGAANFLFKFPLTKLADSVVEMDTIWGSDFLHLREHLLEQPTPDTKITALETWLLRRLRPESAPHPVVGYALERIHQSQNRRKFEGVDSMGKLPNQCFKNVSLCKGKFPDMP